jgi:hypothetical protein
MPDVRRARHRLKMNVAPATRRGAQVQLVRGLARHSRRACFITHSRQWSFMYAGRGSRFVHSPYGDRS